MSRTSQTRLGRNIATVRFSSSDTSFPSVGSDHVKATVVLIARKAAGRQIDQCEHVSSQPGDPTLVVGVSHAKSSAPQRRTRHFRLPSRLRSWAGRSPHLVFLQDEHNLGRRRGRKRQGVCFNIKIPLKRRHDELDPNSLPLAALERDFECIFLMIVFRFIPREPCVDTPSVKLFLPMAFPVQCSHVSGLLVRRLPLALMKSADHGPYQNYAY